MRLPTDKQIKRVLDLLRAEGVPIARIDILDKGVSVSTITDEPDHARSTGGNGSAYDDWKKQDNDRASPRQNAA
ncbi:hypothetical protein [Tsuneonella suprasediminis]|uniref:hypothetical protein n=1 Tax=Tsuneonella suprasediminis TaxID=2306996 RepID=UPI002F94035E